MTSTRLFLSYRREDSAGHAGRLRDDLAELLGDADIFMDIDSITAGEDFVGAIDEVLADCDVVLALIGPRWLAIDGGTGYPRIRQRGDFVRRELAAALERGVRLIPVLVQGATMPLERELPKDLTPLSRRNAFELSDRRWAYDIGELADLLSPGFRLTSPGIDDHGRPLEVGR